MRAKTTLTFLFAAIVFIMLQGFGSSKEPEPCCGGSMTFPANFRTTLEKAWTDSFKPDGTVREQGGSVIEKGGNETMKRGPEGNSSAFPAANFPNPGAGEKRTGTFHTHPYSAAEGGHKNVGFSWQDMAFQARGGYGDKMFVMAGDCIFILETCNAKKAKKVPASTFQKKWTDAYNAGTGSFQDKVEAGVKAAISGSGMCYYKTCKGPTDELIPLTATLEEGDCKKCN